MISFIVTAFNEEANIGPTVETLRRVIEEISLPAHEIIIVDDGSTDATHLRIEQLMTQFPQIRCVRHPENRGLGSAVRSGIEVARHPQFMIIPGDNDMHHDFVLSLLSFRNEADLVLGAPLNKELRSISRNVISMFYQMLYMVSFGLFLNYINGPGIWPTEKARQISLRARRFAIISELNVKLLRSGCSFVEIPGYIQAGPKNRATVTVRNLTEVATSYVALLYEIYVRSPDKFSQRPRRSEAKLINLP
jgi:glycosyltransferase involved in cell wall biosynthesis